MTSTGGLSPRPTLGEGYHSPQVQAAVRLNTNEAPEPPPAQFVAELAEAVGALSYNRYPDRQVTKFREALAEHHGVDADAVFCANGSNEVIQALLLAYGGPGRAAVVFEPTYALHSHIARITSTEVIEGQRRQDYLVDLDDADAVLSAATARIRPPAVVFLCSPNNPTGRAEPEATVRHVLATAPGLVLLDEAYGPFSGSTAIDLVASSPNLVVVRTFSKTWSLAALRLGYAIADPEVVDACFEASLPYHLDSLKQVAGVLALSHIEEMETRVCRLVEERQRVSAGLGQLGLSVVPSDANFILFAIPGADAGAIWARLLEQSVLVRDVSSWPGLSGFLRVTVGLPEENDAFLAALALALATSIG